jgi:Icc-related predicted phosphoesterase
MPRPNNEFNDVEETSSEVIAAVSELQQSKGWAAMFSALKEMEKKSVDALVIAGGLELTERLKGRVSAIRELLALPQAIIKLERDKLAERNRR